ncbi:MAG TPA: putative sulfate exporter family transporter, partial [Rhodanobacter sp.]|nr:putative sulfate exporter family transporter [Rhodanobacter sp.]
AIGLSANIRRMISSGPRPLLLGLGVWVAVAVSSLAVQQVMGQL